MKIDVIYIYVVMKVIIFFNFIMMILLEFLLCKIRLKRRNRKVCISIGICVIYNCLNVYMYFCMKSVIRIVEIFLVDENMMDKVLFFYFWVVLILEYLFYMFIINFFL